ncbi:MAG: S46 family peptidase [Geothrix sp.]|uniref:S46 family peptidase n=1 Tax=Geothrix sp. TaxID=1962974 RepID=UPI0018415C16|nr:S46 family peptidase [Geothrix sp.]NWJ42222.1 S46 family peptidase [Geothrix sp.]WIL19815.1 MAG: S46 family peptidase [Geothrix sp.]
MKPRSLALSLLGFTLAAASLRAEEGMWTFDNLPTKAIQAKYGWAPDQAWLDHLRLSCLRFPGASGSFVSRDGLVLTNHHVGRGWIQRVSSKEHDYVKNGFSAANREAEIKVPGLELVTLMAMDDITDRLSRAVPAGTPEKEALKLRDAEIEKIKKEMQEKSGLTCEHVSLYQGGEHWIYSYKKHTDVRLVFAPELQVALFGGDFDNFTYPRHSLDMTLFRVYENGQPYQPKDFLKWTETGLKAGDLTFVTGHPGRTNRQDTLAQMAYARDFALPMGLKDLESRRQGLIEFGKASPEAARQVETQILGIENGLKARSGYLAGLKNKEALARIQAHEEALRAKVAKSPALQAQAGQSWTRIEQAMKAARGLIKDQSYVGTAHSTLLGHALSLVRITDQEALPSDQRLPEYSDASLKTAKARQGVPAPFYKEQEIFMFTRGLAQAARELGPQHRFVKAMLGGKSPAEVAKAAVEGSRLSDPEVRKALLAGGKKAVAESSDPMILLARKLEPITRELRKKQDELVTSVVAEHGARIAKARFAVYGKNTYPDATFTMRLTYGPVAEYKANGTLMQPFTTIGGLYDRHDGWGGNAARAHDGAWVLPQRWIDRRGAMDPAVPFNFAHKVDIIGGNSGSPVIDRKGELVGLIFDGNIEMLPGNYYYDEAANRGVSLDARAILHALDKVYGATALVAELTGK